MVPYIDLLLGKLYVVVVVVALCRSHTFTGVGILENGIVAIRCVVYPRSTARVLESHESFRTEPGKSPIEIGRAHV